MFQEMTLRRQAHILEAEQAVVSEPIWIDFGEFFEEGITFSCNNLSYVTEKYMTMIPSIILKWMNKNDII